MRLPKEVAFGADVELTVVRSGDVLTLYPVRPTVQDLVVRLRELPAPSDVEVRETDLPERQGL